MIQHNKICRIDQNRTSIYLDQPEAFPVKTCYSPTLSSGFIKDFYFFLICCVIIFVPLMGVIPILLSFRWENRGTETVEDMAALISAVGWCSGWKPLFSIMDSVIDTP